MDIVPCGWVGL